MPVRMQNHPMESPLTNYPISMRLPVFWGDQDLFGHVNNTIYLRWLESARVKYWDDSGMRELMTPRKWGPILAAVHCHYLRQLRYPDWIWVGSRIRRLGNTSLTMEHAVYSESQEVIAAEGESVVVIFNYETQQGTAISPELQAVIERVEGKTFERGERRPNVRVKEPNRQPPDRSDGPGHSM